MRWRRRSEARPQEILSAALSIFAEKGFAAARMDDIAARAGVTKGTIYLYFPSKDAVFKALLKESVGARLDDASALAKGFSGSSAALLTLVLKNLGQFAATSDRVVLPKMVIAEAGNFPDLARFYRDEVIARGLSLFSSIISTGIARGEFRRVEVEHAVRLCVAPILLIMIWRTVFERFDKTPYDHDGLIATHIETLLKGLAVKGEPS